MYDHLPATRGTKRKRSFSSSVPLLNESPPGGTEIDATLHSGLMSPHQPLTHSTSAPTGTVAAHSEPSHTTDSKSGGPKTSPYWTIRAWGSIVNVTAVRAPAAVTVTVR